MNGEVIFYDGAELSFRDNDQDLNACQGKLKTNKLRSSAVHLNSSLNFFVELASITLFVQLVY